MASPKKLTVILAPAVVDELHAIWQWNAERHGPDHADAYLAFLKMHIYSLDRHYRQGQTVIARPDLRYILVHRKTKGHGHVAVHRFDDKLVNVLHVFHTAQDWPSTLAGEESSIE